MNNPSSLEETTYKSKKGDKHKYVIDTLINHSLTKTTKRMDTGYNTREPVRQTGVSPYITNNYSEHVDKFIRPKDSNA